MSEVLRYVQPTPHLHVDEKEIRLYFRARGVRVAPVFDFAELAQVREFADSILRQVQKQERTRRIRSALSASPSR